MSREVAELVDAEVEEQQVDDRPDFGDGDPMLERFLSDYSGEAAYVEFHNAHELVG